MVLSIYTFFVPNHAARPPSPSDEYITDIASPGRRLAQWHNALGLNMNDATDVNLELGDIEVVVEATSWFSKLPTGEDIMQNYKSIQAHSTPGSRTSASHSSSSMSSEGGLQDERPFVFHLDLTQAPEGYTNASLEESLDFVGDYQDVFNPSKPEPRQHRAQVGIVSPKPVRLADEALVAQLHQAALEELDMSLAKGAQAESDTSEASGYSYNLLESNDGSFTDSSSDAWSFHAHRGEVTGEHPMTQKSVPSEMGQQDARSMSLLESAQVRAQVSQAKSGRPVPADFNATLPPTDGDLIMYPRGENDVVDEDEKYEVESTLDFPAAPSMGSIPLPNIGGDSLYDEVGIVNWRFATLRCFATEDEVAELSPITPSQGTLFSQAIF